MQSSLPCPEAVMCNKYPDVQYFNHFCDIFCIFYINLLYRTVYLFNLLFNLYFTTVPSDTVPYRGTLISDRLLVRTVPVRYIMPSFLLINSSAGRWSFSFSFGSEMSYWSILFFVGYGTYRRYRNHSFAIGKWDCFLWISSVTFHS